MSPRPFTEVGRLEVVGTIYDFHTEDFEVVYPNGYSEIGKRQVTEIRWPDPLEDGEIWACVITPTKALWQVGDRVTVRATWDGQGRGKRPFEVKAK